MTEFLTMNVSDVDESSHSSDIQHDSAEQREPSVIPLGRLQVDENVLREMTLDERAPSPALNPFARSASPISGPGLAKPISRTIDPSSKRRIDAALEKNLETIVTQGRRTTTKPSQLAQNDLHLFDSTPAATLAHPAREMTPDSINEDQPVNGYLSRSSTIDYLNPYGQLPWPPAAYPFAHPHPGLYLPYPPLIPGSNTHPSFYPPYDPQGLSAYFAQQQAAAIAAATARPVHEPHPSASDNLAAVLTTPTERSATLVGEPFETRPKKASVNNGLMASYVPSQQYLTINEQFSRLSPDLSSDGDGGATNDADSILSFDSHKSNTMTSMPVLEDGLSDSENLSSDEPYKKPTARHQSTQSDSHKAPAHQQPPAAPVKSSYTATAAAASSASARPPLPPQEDPSTLATDYDTDEETDKLLGLDHRMNARNQAIRDAAVSKPSRPREVQTRVIADPENSSVLIEGVLFRCRYLGSTQLVVEGNPTKVSRMMQAQEVVERIKAPDGENQPSVDVDLFISTEKIMVLNTDLEDILMDHSLRSISYIADIGDLVVLMAKRRYLQHDGSDEPNGTTTRRVVTFNQKLVCHVFESDEAQSIAHSIGQAFQVAYVEFLKANGIDDPSFTRDIDYQEVLEQQEMGSEELDRFSRKECQKEAIVTKGKNEPLGIVIVESGWGSMLPTVVIANMMPGGPAARGGHLNIGDQIISVNGISLVGLPLSSCQTQIKNMKHLTTVRLVVVPCPPVVEVLIRRPDVKYQLGFSVQNGIICSLLRGGIAERGGVRVGHRIIEINGQSVVATPHERIVSMLSHSIGELRMKTMPTQMYRLLTGQETPIYI